jgi:hypothetical protein
MTEGERDSTQDWLLPAARRLPTVFEIEQRIDVALAVARASEAAALELGAAAIDSAEQARRAADLAERASASVNAGAVASVRANGVEPSPGHGAKAAEVDAGGGSGNGEITAVAVIEDPLHHFSERADRVLARLRAIERLPRRTG